jgi:hypothetical protein
MIDVRFVVHESSQNIFCHLLEMIKFKRWQFVKKILKGHAYGLPVVYLYGWRMVDLCMYVFIVDGPYTTRNYTFG